MSGILVCLASNLVCCCSSAACHLCNTRIKPTSSVATRAAYAVLFLLTAIGAWTLQTGWLDHALAKLPSYPFQLYDCPEGNCFSGNFAVARVLFALTLFHAVFAIGLFRVKNSKDFRAGIQNGWWGPKVVVLMALVVAMFFIPNSFFHSYSYVAFAGATIFIFIQLVILIDFAANWSQDWVGKWEDSGSKWWLALLMGIGIFFLLAVLTITVLMYVFFGKKGCRLNIFFVTFNLVLSILGYGLSVSKPVQEARPSSGILQAGVVSLYATYLLVSALSGETYAEDELNCNPFSEGTQQLATVLGTIFTFVAIAYSASRAATNSKVLMGNGEVPKTASAVDEESRMPLIQNEAPPPTVMVDPREPTPKAEVSQQKTTATATAPATTTTTPTANEGAPAAGNSNTAAAAAPADAKTNASAEEPNAQLPPKGGEQELVEIGVLPSQKNKRRHLEEAVESGALPKSALLDSDDDDKDDDEEKGMSREDEKKACAYNYSYYHLVFVLAAMYVTMLINGWSTTNTENGELVGVGHDWASVWVKVVSSWIAVLLYVWTLVAPILFPNRDWN